MTGAKADATRAVPPALDSEQHHQDEDRERPHVVLERRGHELEAFDRRQHRNRRPDHGIGDEHRCADHAERQQQQASPAERLLPQRHRRQRAALAVIVGAQQQEDVFRRDDDQQRPEHQRGDAEHRDARHCLALRRAGNRPRARHRAAKVPMSANTTPMLPSVSAQKPAAAAPSWASCECGADSHAEENEFAGRSIPRLKTLPR
jgi:hypothetical protein